MSNKTTIDILEWANLKWANLKRADLKGANLEGADLEGADLDYSSGFTLSCKGSRFNWSLKHVFQYFAHICTNSVSTEEESEADEIKRLILPYALKSHRAGDLGIAEIAKELEQCGD